MFSENGVQNWTCFPRAPNGSPEPSQNPFREHFGAQMASLGHNFQNKNHTFRNLMSLSSGMEILDVPLEMFIFRWFL